VFGALFGVGQQFFGQSAILRGVGATPSRARQRTTLDDAPIQPHQHLGRGADQPHAVGQLQVEM
jgi:hypothetical protein